MDPDSFFLPDPDPGDPKRPDPDPQHWAWRPSFSLTLTNIIPFQPTAISKEQTKHPRLASIFMICIQQFYDALEFNFIFKDKTVLHKLWLIVLYCLLRPPTQYTLCVTTWYCSPTLHELKKGINIYCTEPIKSFTMDFGWNNNLYIGSRFVRITSQCRTQNWPIRFGNAQSVVFLVKLTVLTMHINCPTSIL